MSLTYFYTCSTPLLCHFDIAHVCRLTEHGRRNLREERAALLPQGVESRKRSLHMQFLLVWKVGDEFLLLEYYTDRPLIPDSLQSTVPCM